MADWIREMRIKEIRSLLKRAVISPEQKKAIEFVDGRNVLNGMSPATRISSIRLGISLAQFMKKPFEDATREDIENYLLAKSSVWKGNSMVNQKSILRRFYTLLFNAGNAEPPEVVSWITMRMPRNETKLPSDMVTPEEVHRMIRAVSHPRDKAVVSVLYDSAARVGELCGLRVGDVEFDQYGARLNLAGKTGARRVRIIHSVPDLRGWFNCHPWADNHAAPLIANFRSRTTPQPLLTSGVNSIVHAAARAAGLRKRVHPHLLRHSRLTDLAKTLSESELKIFAGWTADSKMARVYVHLSGEDVERKLLERAGILKREDAEQPSPLAPRVCLRCGEENGSASRLCTRCALPLDQDKLRDLTREYDSLREKLPLLLDLLDDPAITRLIAKRARTSSFRHQENPGTP